VISSERAARIGADALHKKGEAGSYRTGEVLDPNDVNRLPLVYSVPRETILRCWIVHCAPIRVFGLMSSTVLLIDRETGDAIYFGSAHDEG
jgi:hypothetical protein